MIRPRPSSLVVEFNCPRSSRSSSSPPSPHPQQTGFPADLYLEGPDQYRGWFHSSLLIGVGVRDAAPYRQVLTHGWTLDEQGRAMSKSRGNDVDPADIANRLGGEIVRLWVASVDFREDVVGSEGLMQRIAETYRNIRNVAFKNSLGNLYDFTADKAVAFEQMIRYVKQYQDEVWIPLRREVADYLLAGSNLPAEPYRPLDRGELP